MNNVNDTLKQFTEGKIELEQFRNDLRKTLEDRESYMDELKRELKLGPAEGNGKAAADDVANAIEVGTFMQTAVRARNGDFVAQKVMEGWRGKATMVEGTPALGGHTVPDETAATLERMFEENGVMEQRARTINMNRLKYNIPVETDVPAAQFHTEGDTIAATSATFDIMNLEAYRQDAYVDASKELFADSNLDIINILMEQMTESVARGVDSAIFNGDGTATYALASGIFNAVGAGASLDISAADVNSMVVGDLIKLYNEVPTRLRRQGMFVMHPDVAKVLKLETTGSDGEYLLNPYAAQRSMAVHGFPIVESSEAPNTLTTGQPIVSFCNPQKIVIGRRQSMEVLVDPYSQASTWTSRIYFVRRLAIGTVDTDAVARLMIA
jgi:HK97 family phage major capsid protein